MISGQCNVSELQTALRKLVQDQRKLKRKLVKRIIIRCDVIAHELTLHVQQTKGLFQTSSYCRAELNILECIIKVH